LSGTAAGGGRADALESLLGDSGVDALLVTELTNVEYLTGFTGTNGLVLVAPGLRVFLTDFRYVERAAEEVGEGWERPEVGRELLPHVFERVAGNKIAKLGFEDAHVSVRQLEQLREKAPEGAELVAAGDLVEQLRMVKDDEELKAIAAAARLADEVYEWAIAQGLIGKTERAVAVAAEARMRDLGAEPSFPSIVAGGPNGALPHAEPGDREIAAGELVVFDMGAKLDGYCSDCTRTFATGEVSDLAREVYELVRIAQQAALEAVLPGAGGKAVDTVARDLIAAGGHGERFGHGLGHGVGIEIHEKPTLSVASEDVLAAGNVVTVEPGIYVAGEVGVRIEDLVIVRDGAPENLSSLSKELTLVG
jgi:Xaa-Pro aminopeptidase